MTKIISLITLLLFSITTHADDFDILGTWYQYEADHAGLDGIWVFNANNTGTHEEFYHGESEGISNFTYTFDAANCILTIITEGDEDDPFVMHITIVSPTEFTYSDGYDVLRWVRQPIDGTSISINEENFPDDIFRNYLLYKYGSDGLLTEEEITEIKSLSVNSYNISSLKGIEFFTALEELECHDNQLTTLDLSNNIALKKLYCYSNPLVSLNISGCALLLKLNCCSCQLTTLDISKNTKLEWLECDDNKLTTLNISKNLELKSLYCYNNQLTSIDLTKNIKLEEILCPQNLLTNLDVSKNTALEYLECGRNQLTTLDVSHNPALKTVYCDANQFTTLDFSNNASLTYLFPYRNKIRGAGLDALINSLPIVSNGKIFFINNMWNDEENECTTTQVAAAKAKGWTIFYQNGIDWDWNWVEYEGIDPSGIIGTCVDRKSSGPKYNLSGQQLTTPRKGINIINGKKVIIR